MLACQAVAVPPLPSSDGNRGGKLDRGFAAKRRPASPPLPTSQRRGRVCGDGGITCRIGAKRRRLLPTTSAAIVWPSPSDTHCSLAAWVTSTRALSVGSCTGQSRHHSDDTDRGRAQSSCAWWWRRSDTPMQFDSVAFLASVGAHLSIMMGLATGHRTHSEASVFLWQTGGTVLKRHRMTWNPHAAAAGSR